MAAHPDPEALPATPFHDLDAFLDLPRVSGLAVSPDGTRVVTTITRLDDERAEFRGALWEVHPGGEQPARRIKDKKVSAVLHSGYPVRSWDHDIGPEQTHLFCVGPDDCFDKTAGSANALRDNDFDVRPDVSFLVTSSTVPSAGAALRSILVRVDLRTAQRHVIVDDRTRISDNRRSRPTEPRWHTCGKPSPHPTARRGSCWA